MKSQGRTNNSLDMPTFILKVMPRLDSQTKRILFSKHRDLHMLWLLLTFVLLTGLDSIQARTAHTVVVGTEPSFEVDTDDAILARQAIAALDELGGNVLAYESLHEFESSRRLARVPLETFTNRLNEATAKVESILSRMSETKLKTHLRNSLYSYRDGAFWWSTLQPQRVVSAQSHHHHLASITPAGHFFSSTVPYTVVVHWRQAQKSLRRARALIPAEKKSLR